MGFMGAQFIFKKKCDAFRNLVPLVPFASACNFTKINSLLWVFFTFFKLYKWYQIAQRTTNV